MPIPRVSISLPSSTSSCSTSPPPFPILHPRARSVLLPFRCRRVSSGGSTNPISLTLLRRVQRRIRIVLHGKISGRIIRISRQNVLLDPGQAIDQTVRKVQGLADDGLGRETEPLVDADVLVLGGLEDLHVDDGVGVRADVFDVVRVGHEDVADVAGLEIRGARVLWAREGGDARPPGQEEVPLVRRQVPVDLAHRARLDGEDGRGEVAGDREDGGVGDLDGAAGDGERLLFREVVRV